jgi:hypothetical protein
MNTLAKYRIEIATALLIASINIPLALLSGNQQISDAHQYHLLAVESVRLGEFYPHAGNLHDTYLWPSLYINTLAVLYAAFDTSPTVGKLLNALLLVVQFLALSRIIRLLFGDDRKTALSFCLLFLTYPALHLANVLTRTEPLFITLSVLSLMFFLEAVRRVERRPLYAALAALLISGAILTRPVALLVPLAMILFMVYAKTGLRTISVFVATVGIVIGLYGMSTQDKLGTFNAIGTTGGLNLLYGHNPYSVGRGQVEGEAYVAEIVERTKGAQPTVFEYNRLFTEEALRHIAENPARTIAHTFKRLFYLFAYDGKIIEHAFDAQSLAYEAGPAAISEKLSKGLVAGLIILNQVFYMSLIVFGVYGVALLLRAREYRTLYLALLLPVCFFLPTIIAVGASMYHFPIIVSAFPVIALGLARFLSAIKARQVAPSG